MKNMELLPGSGRICKANMHCHTTISDGGLTPEQIRRAYQGAGYSVVAFTDHRRLVAHPELTDENFVALTGVEMDLTRPFSREEGFARIPTYHINFYDCTPGVRPGFVIPPLPERYGDIPALNEYVANFRAQGFLACYNHPYWSLHTYDDYKDLRGYDFMEIYNHGSELDGMYGWTRQVYDEMLRAGQRLGCIAGDDNHNGRKFDDPKCDSFGGFTVLRVPELTYENVVEALRSRAVYASSGPIIESLTLENGAVCVRCTPVERIYMMTAGRRAQSAVSGTGDSLTAARFPLEGTEGYVRVECCDSRGRRACTRAYFLDEWE